MKKRILSILLIAVMLTGVLGMNAFAKANDEFTVRNIRFTFTDTNTYAYTLIAGKTIRVSAEVERNAAGSGEISLAACLYGTTRVMSGMAKSEPVTLKKGEKKTITVDYKLPSGVNGQTHYLLAYGLDAKDGVTTYKCENPRQMQVPADRSGGEETVHLTVNNEKRQQLKGVGVSYAEGSRVTGNPERNYIAREMLHSEDGTNFNLLRLWLQMAHPTASYDKKTDKVIFHDAMRSFKSAYIDSGLVEDLKKITNNNLKICVTPSTVMPAEFRESAAQNVVLNTQNAVQLKNATVKNDVITDIKNGGSVIFGGIDVPNPYKMVKLVVGSKFGGTIYLENADKGNIMASFPIPATGGDTVMQEFFFERQISMNNVKNVKLRFEANGESFGSFKSMCIDGNTIIKMSKVADCADLMANCVETIYKEHNIFVDYITVFNEPLFHHTPEQLRTLVKELRKALDRRGMNKVKILADEWAEIDEFTLYSWEKLLEDKEALDAIDGFSFHSYKTHGLDYFEKVKHIFEEAGKEVWMTESSDTEILTALDNGDVIQGAEQSAKMLNDFNNYVEYWVHFFGAGWGGPLGTGNDATSIIGVITAEKDWISTNGCYKYYKQIMDAFDYGCTFRYCTTTEYGDMARPRGKKPPINAAFAQNEDGNYTLALVNSSQERYMSEAWANQNNNPYAITENVEVYIEELANVAEIEFDVVRSGPQGFHISEESVVAKNGRFTVTLEDSELLTLRSK